MVENLPAVTSPLLSAPVGTYTCTDYDDLYSKTSVDSKTDGSFTVANSNLGGVCVCGVCVWGGEGWGW